MDTTLRRSFFFTWLFLPLLISTLFAYTIHFLAQPPPPHTLRPKIFVIGLSKTGTTSVGDALERLGYRRLGWRHIRSRHLVHTWARGDLRALLAATASYDAFEDLPWPMVFREMAARFPDARFVLTRRRDDHTWLRSMRVHLARGEWLPYRHFYAVSSLRLPTDEDAVLQAYRNHTSAVRDYFRHLPDRFVEMVIEDPDEVNWNLLCRMAQCPGGAEGEGEARGGGSVPPTIPFPESNTAASWKVDVVSHTIQWCWGWLVTRGEEQAAKYYYDSRWTGLRPLLRILWWMYDVIERAYTELCFQISSWISPPFTL